MQLTRKFQNTALSTSCTAHIIQDGMSATIYVLLPVLAQSFGLNYTQVGLFKGLKSLAQAVLEISSGFVTERFGELRVIIFGLLLSGLGYIGLAFAPNTMLLLAFLFVIGTGTAFQHAPASALVISAYPADGRRGPLGIYNSSGDVGKLIFTGAFSLAIGASIAWQSVSLAFGVAAILAALALIGLQRSVDENRQEQATSGAADGGNDEGLGWGILDGRSFSLLLAVVFFDTMVQAGVLVFTAFLLIAKGSSIAVATSATVILLIGGIGGKAGCGFLSDRLGVRPAFALIQVLTAAGLVAIALMPNWAALLLLLPLGVVVQGSTSITYGFAADLIHPHRMARGYALLYSSSSFASVAGPLAFGVVADVWGIEMTMHLLGAAALLALPMFALLPERTETAAGTA